MIALIGSTPRALGSPLVEDVLARWPQAERPRIEALTLERVLSDDAALKDCSIAWVVLEAADAAGVHAALDRIAERRVPAMITRPGDTAPAGTPFQDGIVFGPPAADPATLFAVLRTLHAQSGIVRGLQHEMRLIQAHQGGLCDQIGKMDEELRLAAQLQREFLPQDLPRIGPVEVKVLFRPASYVSGDIYDVIRLDEEHMGLFLADAVGHGVPAALMTMYIKRALHTKCLDPASPRGYRITPPDEALSRLNQDMAAQQTSGKVRFATACYGIINCRTLVMTFARAGHPFPMVLHSDGTTDLLAPDGGMLGIFPEEVYERVSVQLRPGDRLLIYSDGFELAFPKCDIHGTPVAAIKGKERQLAHERYCEEFKLLANGTLEEALERLVATLDRQAGSLNQQDDMTVLCVGVNAPAARAAADDEAEREAMSPMAAA